MQIAVVGATGMVGRQMVKALDVLDGKFDVTLFASDASAGKTLTCCGRELTVRALPKKWEEGFDYVLMSAGGDLSRRLAPEIAETGSVVIDNSSAWRRVEGVPLVVPEVNGELLKGYGGIVANPNCSTIQLVLALEPVRQRWGLKRVIVSTYQAVSGAGRKGLDELEAQEQGDGTCRAFPAPIHRNVVPAIGAVEDNGFTEEENKLNFEPAKIFAQPDLNVLATAVRVPVEHGHSESVWVRTERPVESMAALQEAFATAADVELVTDRVLTPMTHAPDSDITYVSRLRLTAPDEILFWNVAHNLRVGAATNAVRILQTHRYYNREV